MNIPTPNEATGEILAGLSDEDFDRYCDIYIHELCSPAQFNRAMIELFNRTRRLYKNIKHTKDV